MSSHWGNHPGTLLFLTLDKRVPSWYEAASPTDLSGREEVLTLPQYLVQSRMDLSRRFNLLSVKDWHLLKIHQTQTNPFLLVLVLGTPAGMQHGNGAANQSFTGNKSDMEMSLNESGTNLHKVDEPHAGENRLTQEGPFLSCRWTPISWRSSPRAQRRPTSWWANWTHWTSRCPHLSVWPRPCTWETWQRCQCQQDSFSSSSDQRWVMESKDKTQNWQQCPSSLHFTSTSKFNLHALFLHRGTMAWIWVASTRLDAPWPRSCPTRCSTTSRIRRRSANISLPESTSSWTPSRCCRQGSGILQSALSPRKWCLLR